MNLRSVHVVVALAATCMATLVGCSPEHPAGPSPAPVTVGQFDPVPAASPTGLDIPSVGIDADVRTMDATECPVLDPPTSDDAYWVQCRAMPGTDSDGTVFIIGHAIVGGGGVFDDLHDISPGADVEVATPNGTLAYRVDRTASFAKYGEAQQAPELRERVPGRLVLVTCSTDPHASTEQNFVAFASLVGSTAES